MSLLGYNSNQASLLGTRDIYYDTASDGQTLLTNGNITGCQTIRTKALYINGQQVRPDNVGLTGAIGYTGYTGPIGYTGFTGSIGYTGWTGFTGPIGPQGPQGVQGQAGDATAATASAAAAAASATAAGVSAAAAATSATAASASAAASATSASLAQDSAALSASYARHFIASDAPKMETCNALFRIKDTNNISTVSTLDQYGNAYFTNSINLNTSGDLTTNQTTINTNGVYTNNLQATSTTITNIIPINLVLNVATSNNVNVINIGSPLSIINLVGYVNTNGRPISDPFHLTEYISQI